jgi:hypothetical protein
VYGLLKKARARGVIGTPKAIYRRAILDNPNAYLKHVSGVIHVGANSGQECLARHKEIWPQVREIAQVKLRSTTLDTLLSQQGRAGFYDALVLDTQGSELLVLKGATKISAISSTSKRARTNLIV